MANRDQPALARLIQELAESGDYEGFNAILGAITKEQQVDAPTLDVIKRDPEFRRQITDVCHEAWTRKRPPGKI